MILEQSRIFAAEWVMREPRSGTRSGLEAPWYAWRVAAPLNGALELPSNEAVGAEWLFRAMCHRERRRRQAGDALLLLIEVIDR